jgi:TolA-binding protein
LRAAALVSLVVLLLPLGGCETHQASLALYEKAKSLWDEGQYVDAARTYLTVAEIYPDSPLVEDALFWAANLYHYYLKDRELAERYYQQLMVQYPEGKRYVEAMQRLAELYDAEKDSKYQAILLYRKLMLEDALAERRDRFLLKIARAYMALGRLEQARFELRRLVMEFPKSPLLPQAYYLVGYSYYWEGRKPLAVIALNQIQKDFPKDPLAPQGRFFVAEIFEEEGIMRKALDVYESLKGQYAKPDILDKRIQALRARMGRSVR